MAWIAAAAAIGGSLISADANRSASNKARGSTKAADELQRLMYEQTRQDNMPALQARNNALAQLQQLLGVGGDPKAANYGVLNKAFTGADMLKEPGYQFGLTQGTQALERSAAARGGLYSGATMKALQRYGQDYAGTKFNEAFTRSRTTRGDMFDRFASLAGLGQTGASQMAGSGQNYANQVGSNQIGLANFQGAAGIHQGNQISNGMNQLAAWAMNNNQNQSHPEYKADGTGMWWNGP